MSQNNKDWLGECGPKILNFLQNVSMWTLISSRLYEDGGHTSFPCHFSSGTTPKNVFSSM